MDIEVIEFPGCRYAAVEHVGPFDEIGAAFDRLSTWIGSHLHLLVGAPMMVYLDDPGTTPPQEQRCHAAVPVAESADDAELAGMRIGRVAPGRCAVLRHVGPYSGLGEAWAALTGWVAAEGLAADASRSVFEVYQSNPSEVPEAELVTVLYLPVV